MPDDRGAKPASVVRRALVIGGSLAAAVLFFGFPDLDIRLLGIGAHRNFLFHSALITALLFFLARARREKAGWLLASVLAAGCGVGIAAHLGVDVFQSKSVVFPFVGTLVRGSSVDDRLWLAANSAISLLLGAASLRRTSRA
jgi:hypothetical protein